MLFWWLIEILFTGTLQFISIEIPDEAQINDELYTFSNFLTKEPIFNLTLEIYANFPICVCVCYFYHSITAVANYLTNSYNHWQILWEKLLFGQFFPPSPLTMFRKKWVKLMSSDVMVSQYCIGERGIFKHIF